MVNKKKKTLRITPADFLTEEIPSVSPICSVVNSPHTSTLLNFENIKKISVMF